MVTSSGNSRGSDLGSYKAAKPSERETGRGSAGQGAVNDLKGREKVLAFWD
jgi:hypothetical protein